MFLRIKENFIRDGNDFIRKIKTSLHKKGVQVSFDVEALFLFIQMDEDLIILVTKNRNDANLSNHMDLYHDEILALIKEWLEFPISNVFWVCSYIYKMMVY